MRPLGPDTEDDVLAGRCGAAVDGDRRLSLGPAGAVVEDGPGGGQATFPNTKVSGTPSGGLSNPTTTFTIVRGPGNSGF